MTNFRTKQNIEAISYLSPLQQGLLAHSLQEGRDDPYFYQSTFDIEGELDVAAFGRAWEAVVAKYPVLRSDYRWEEIARPVQVVYRSGAAQCALSDWRGQPEAEQEQAMAALLAAERAQGFDFRRAADNRLRLVRLADRRHCLVWSYHHITLDGWSLALILRDVLAAYRALVQGAAPQLAAARPYRDYLQWLQGRDLEAGRAYWRHALAGCDAATPLPQSTPAEGAGKYAEQALHLSSSETAQLRRFAAQHQLTLNTMVQGAWAILLGRHARSDDVLFGCTVSGRPPELAGVEQMAGLFINTQPLRARMPAAQSVAPWLRTLQAQAAEQRQYEHMPLAEIQASFDSIVVFENYPVDASLMAGRGAVQLHHVRRGRQAPDSEGVVHTSGRNNYPLSLIVKDGERLELVLAYSCQRFSHGAIGGMLRQLQSLLAAFCARPEALLSALSLCSEAERRALAMQATGTSFAGGYRSIQAQWAEHAAREPGAPALRYEERALTRAELERKANQVAHYLVARGVGPEVRVALRLTRSIELVVGLLGILKAGGVAVPLDPKMPEERLAFQLTDAKAALTIGPGLLEDPELARCPETALPERVRPGNAAYVIYTSGSTGQPKGVVVSHGALANYVAAVWQRLPAEIASMAWVSTVAADLGHTVLFGALAGGKCLHVVADERAFDPDRFAEYMAEHRIDALKIVPSHLAGLLQAADPARALPRRCLIVGGEASSWQLVQRLQTLAPDCLVLNHYGPTETTVGVLTYAYEGTPRADSRILPLGRALANNRIYVLDAHLQPVPHGVAGEVYIGGEQLARGYLDQPAMTAERFVPDPFGGEGGRLYRTGDLARMLSDGSLEYLDRADHQVKVRGYRVEPGEIAAQLKSEVGIDDAVVLLLKAGETAQLVAYVLAAPDCDLAAVKARLAVRVPDYMVPSALVRLDRWPLTANGKLDRRALPAPDARPMAPAADAAAPRNDTEATLAAVWRDVLKVEHVGIHDSFFALGGDSILSLQVIAKARARGLRLTPKQMFDKPTIAQAAQVAVPVAAKPKEAGLAAVSADLPLTPIQQWFFKQELTQPNHWNQSVLLSAAQALDRACLGAALQAVAAQHDALRLRFTVENGIVRQRLAAELAPVTLQAIELAPEASIEDACTGVQRSLDIARGPLLAAAHLRLPDGNERLLLAVHHLAVDGVSWRVLLEDLDTAYAQARAGQPILLPPKSASWQAWAIGLDAAARAPRGTDELGYWQSALQPMSLPCKDAQGENTVGSAQRIGLSLSAEETRQLLQVAPSAYRTQVNDLLLAALAQALGAWSGSPHVLVELEGHGREDVAGELDLSRTVGWFTSRFPVCLPAMQDVPAAIKAVKECLRAIPNKGIGYGLLKYQGDASTRAAMAGLPQPEASFNYLGQFDGAAASGAFRLSDEGTGVNRAGVNRRSHGLDIVGQVTDGVLTMTWTYSPQRYDDAAIARLTQDHMDRLRALVAHCVQAEGGATPSDFPLAQLAQEELDRLPARAIEDIYPLAPMQEGMLFHSLYAPDADVYVNQLKATFAGTLDADAFRDAWLMSVSEHAILRTSFLTERAGDAQQVVWRAAALPFAVYDWRDIEAGEPAARLAQCMEQDRQRGFNLEQAPLMRVTLVKRPDGATEFIWTKHHLLLDGWSSARLLNEVLARYCALVDGAALPVVGGTAGRYRDYVAWLAEQAQDAAQQFWRDTLAGLSGPLRLADAVARPREGAGGHGVQVLHLPAALTTALQRSAQTHQVTLNTLVQAAWALLLSRYSGRDDVVFGITVAGRSAEVPGIDGMLGLFINTLPLFQQLDSAQDLGDWLRRLQAANADLRQYETTPLADIQRCNNGGGGNALFDTLFVFENYPVDAALDERRARLGITDVHAHSQTSYPLSLTVVPGEQLRIDFVYDRASFDDAAMARMQGHLRCLLAGLADTGSVSVGDIALLDAEERRSLTQGWHAPQSAFPYTAPVHELFARHAAATPDAVALSCEGASLTYGELNAAANRVAHRLLALGVRPDERVAVFLERGPWLLVALLGVLKAGAGYVPLDPAYPVDRLAYMLDDSAPVALLTSGALKASLPPCVMPVLMVDDVDMLAGMPASDPVAVGLQPQHLAYVIYTSGSTGMPKGVMVEHRNVTRLLAATEACFGFGPQDVWTLFHSFAFDFSVWEIWGALAYGGRLVVVPADCARSAEDFYALLCREQVTVLNQTPSAFRALAAAQAASGADHALRHIIFGGEALELHTLKPWIERNDPLRTQLTNMYGITETTVHVTYRRLRREDIERADGSMVGGPIPDLRVYILDAQRRPVPVGVSGELYVGGAGVARGYLNRPELTTERFIADPFSADPQARLYKSGDLGRWTAQGDIEYLGRNDFQVKIRGFRIELGEIEARLAACAGVRDAVVIAREDRAGDKRLVAYYLGEDLPVAQLRRDLGASLAEHMVPSAFVRMESWPLTANGKLDRKALPAPEYGGEALAYAAPRNETEAALAGIWSEVLGVAQVGIHDNFFVLGGHSLLVMQVASRASIAFGRKVALATVFQQATIAELAAALAQQEQPSANAASLMADLLNELE